MRAAVQVAMLFLTVAEIFHEPTWKLWFQEAAGLIPASALKPSSETLPSNTQEVLRPGQSECFIRVLVGLTQWSVHTKRSGGRPASSLLSSRGLTCI